MSQKKRGEVIGGFILQPMPHPLLTPDANPAYRAIRESYAKVRAALEELNPDLIVIYSTRWASIIGHQIQSDPNPKWNVVDQNFHALGTIHYDFRVDQEFGESWCDAAKSRGLTARCVNYHGFPVDTGSLVNIKLLNPDNRFPVSIVSCNVYADRAETIVLGKSARDAIEASGKRVVTIAVTGLSSRQWTNWIDPADDRINSPKDDDWNRKLLSILDDGRLEDVAQLARTFSAEANGDNRMKAIWWLAAVMGQHNAYDGVVYDYQPVWGTGAALVGLTPNPGKARDLEYDEDDVELYKGDRDVLSVTDDVAENAEAM